MGFNSGFKGLIVPEMILALFLCDITDLILTVCIFIYVDNSKRTAIFAQVHTSELEDTCQKSAL